MTSAIEDSARIVDSTVGRVEIREYVTVHDSEIRDGGRIYERSTIKKSYIDEDVDVNAGAYIENADVGINVQCGPNCSVVGVTHELSEEGMTFREDVFERIVLHERVFVGANAVVSPGVEIGEGTVIAPGATVARDVGAGKLVRGTPPAQQIVALAEWLDR